MTERTRPKEIIILVVVSLIIAAILLFILITEFLLPSPTVKCLPYLLLLAMLIAGSIGLWQGREWGRLLLSSFWWLTALLTMGRFAHWQAHIPVIKALGKEETILVIPDIPDIMLVLFAIISRAMLYDRKILEYCGKPQGLRRSTIIIDWLILLLALPIAYYIGARLGTRYWYHELTKPASIRESQRDLPESGINQPGDMDNDPRKDR
jgi:hypothetical protein